MCVEGGRFGFASRARGKLSPRSTEAKRTEKRQKLPVAAHIQARKRQAEPSRRRGRKLGIDSGARVKEEGDLSLGNIARLQELWADASSARLDSSRPSPHYIKNDNYFG